MNPCLYLSDGNRIVLRHYIASVAISALSNRLAVRKRNVCAFEVRFHASPAQSLDSQGLAFRAGDKFKRALYWHTDSVYDLAISVFDQNLVIFRAK